MEYWFRPHEATNFEGNKINRNKIYESNLASEGLANYGLTWTNEQYVIRESAHVSPEQRFNF